MGWSVGKKNLLLSFSAGEASNLNVYFVSVKLREMIPTQSFYQNSFMQLKNQCEWNCCCCPEDSPSCRQWNFAQCCLGLGTTRGIHCPASGSLQEFILPGAFVYLICNVQQCWLGQSFSNSLRLLENKSNILLIFLFYLTGHMFMWHSVDFVLLLQNTVSHFQTFVNTQFSHHFPFNQ